MRLLRRYWLTLVLLGVYLLLALFDRETGAKAVMNSLESVREVFLVLPPIFILLGLLDVWVPRETMVKLTGDGSGAVGIIIAFLLGSVAAGPLYAAFPVAGVLLRKGSRFTNVLIFIGAWSTTKVPLLLFEASALGWQFMAARLAADIFGIVAIAYVTDKALTPREKEAIYAQAAAAG